MADQKITDLPVATSVTAADLLHIVDEATTNKQVTWANLEGSIDHGNITGLGDDDHTQYLLADGSRALSGDLLLSTNAMKMGEDSTPTNAANFGFLYAQDDGGDTELYYLDDSNNEVQITKDGAVNAAAAHGTTVDIKNHGDVAAAVTDSMAWGDVYFANGTPELDRLAPGSAGEVLTSGGAGADVSWSAAGSGDFTGPGASTDNGIVRFDGAGGKTGQDSGVTITDGDVLTLAGNLDMSAAAYDILIPDNEAAALQFLEGANAYITLITTDAGELVQIHKTLDLDASLDMSTGAYDISVIDNNAAALELKEAGNAYITLVTTNASETVLVSQVLDLDANLDMATGAYDVLIKDNEAAALDFTEAANSYLAFVTTNASEAVKVGQTLDLDANLDMSTGAYDLLIPDNEATALQVLEGANSYITLITTNGSETVQIHKLLDLDANLNMATGAYDILIKDDEAAALEFLEAANAYLTLVTTDGSETVKISKTLDLDANLDVATGAYDVLLKDNEAAALDFTEAANSYMTFVTTDASEVVKFSKAIDLDANLDMSTGGYDILIPDNTAAALEFKEGANAYITLVSSDAAELITLHKEVTFNETACFDAEFDNGNSGAADTVDWGVGNKQKSTLTGNCTFTYTAPNGPASLIHKLIQDGTGSRTVTWPATVKWAGGTAPTLSTGAADVDLILLYYDGTSYYGGSILDLS